MYDRWVIIRRSRELDRLVRERNSRIYWLASITFIFITWSVVLISNGYAVAPASAISIPSSLPGHSTQANTPALLSMAWSKTYGTPGQDEANSVIQVSDGYVIVGQYDKDLSIVKTDTGGNKVWNKTYGGKGDDEARSIIAVDGGYVIAGSSSSYENGNVYDVYLLKIDLNGDMIWYRTYESTLNGHLTNAYGNSVVATDDGYTIVGDTYVNGDGNMDIYLLKTDLNGTLVWTKTIGGNAVECGNSIISVPDGYVITGDTYSYGNSVTSGVSSSDVYLVKTDLNGNLVWNRTFGGKYVEHGNSVIAVDNGYMIVGSTNSQNNSKDYDVYLVKTDLNGNMTWENHYGKADDDQGTAVIQVSDGYVITGYTSTIGNFFKDVYLLKTDTSGNLDWERSYGGPDMDVGNSIVQANDGYVIAGYSCTYGIYTADFYLLKVAYYTIPDPTAIPMTVVTPTPTPTPTPSTGLSVTDMGIIAAVTIGLIVIAVAGVVSVYYFFPKK